MNAIIVREILLTLQAATSSPERRAYLAMASLPSFADPKVWGDARTRWRRAYQTVRLNSRQYRS